MNGFIKAAAAVVGVAAIGAGGAAAATQASSAVQVTLAPKAVEVAPSTAAGAKVLVIRNASGKAQTFRIVPQLGGVAQLPAFRGTKYVLGDKVLRSVYVGAGKTERIVVKLFRGEYVLAQTTRGGKVNAAAAFRVA